MKIITRKNKIEILDNDGKDLTKSLEITSFKTVVDGTSPHKTRGVIYIDNVEHICVDEDNK